MKLPGGMPKDKLWLAVIIVLATLLLWLAFFWQPARPLAIADSAHQTPPSVDAPAGGGHRDGQRSCAMPTHHGCGQPECASQLLGTRR